MKTAEEWQPEINHLPLLSERTSVAEKATIDWIRKIQLDAIKEGMTRAMQILCHRSDKGIVGSKEAADAILSERKVAKI